MHAGRPRTGILGKFNVTALPLEASDEDAFESHSISDVAEPEVDDTILRVSVQPVNTNVESLTPLR